MEQLQRQHGAKLEMNLQEKHLLHAQLLLAQHAAAARASDSSVDQTYQADHQALNGRITRMDPDEEDEDSDEEEPEMVETEENDEVEEGVGEVGDGPPQQVKKPGFQQVVGFPLTPYSTAHSSAVKEMSESPPSAIKQEQEEKALLSPAGKPNFTSPNGSADWGYDEPLRQVRCPIKLIIVFLCWTVWQSFIVITSCHRLQIPLSLLYRFVNIMLVRVLTCRFLISSCWEVNCCPLFLPSAHMCG